MNKSLLCMLSISLSNVLSAPNTVTELNVNQYLGRWYQVYGLPTNQLFQGYGTCITADYGISQDGNVTVLNSQLNKKNELEQISGYAYYTNPNDQGKLTVHLNGVPVDSPYWVVKLGEVVNEQYQYSIITTPSSFALWVLTRDIDTFFQLYNEETVEFLNQYQYNYVPIKQSNCEYSTLF